MGMLYAGAGNLALAAGRGMGKPCFRIIQTHFAVANNNGDVAAKEEVNSEILPLTFIQQRGYGCRGGCGMNAA